MRHALATARVRVLLQVRRGLVAVVDALVRRRGQRGERADAPARDEHALGLPRHPHPLAHPVEHRELDRRRARAARPAAGEGVVARCRSGRPGRRPGCSGCRCGRRSAGGRRAARAAGARRRARRSPAADRRARHCTARSRAGRSPGRSARSAAGASSCSQRSTSRSHTWWPRRRSSSGGRLSGSTDGDNRAMRAAMMRSFSEPLAVETVDDPICRRRRRGRRGPRDRRLPQRLARVVGPRPGRRAPARRRARALRRRGVGRLRRARVDGRRPRHGPVLLRLRRLRAVPARRDPALRPRLPAGLHRLGLVRRATSRCRAPTSTSSPCPTRLADVEAASLGCRFMTAWAALHVHAGVRAGEWVAVHGCGGVGLAAVMIAPRRARASSRSTSTTRSWRAPARSAPRPRARRRRGARSAT